MKARSLLVLATLFMLSACIFKHPGVLSKTTQSLPLSGSQSSKRITYVEGTTKKICQLIGDNDRERKQSTLNLTFTRYKLAGTDLGFSFQSNGGLFFLFGDTVGINGGDSIAFTTDSSPEDCLDLEFVTDDHGNYLPLKVPGISLGAFEVPMAGLSVLGSNYVFFTTDYDVSSKNMGRSIVARSNSQAKTFEYLYDFSRDKFINISPVIVANASLNGLPNSSGQGILFWGSGAYRKSNVFLAYKSLSSIDTPGEIKYFSGVASSGSPLWSDKESDAVPLFDHPCVGELSVAWDPFLKKWLMLYNCIFPRGINFRTADYPWGPWSEAQVLFDPWKDGGYCHFMHVSTDSQICDAVSDPGREKDWAGEYGPYMIPSSFTGDGDQSTIYFVMSTWNPYTVELMKSTFIQK